MKKIKSLSRLRGSTSVCKTITRWFRASIIILFLLCLFGCATNREVARAFRVKQAYSDFQDLLIEYNREDIKLLEERIEELEKQNMVLTHNKYGKEISEAIKQMEEMKEEFIQFPNTPTGKSITTTEIIGKMPCDKR